MRPIALLIAGMLLMGAATAQDAATPKPKKDWSKLNIANRPKDHFLIQLGYNHWANSPDSINRSGLPRSINVYFMMDFPFKTDPRISVALGAGVGSDNQYFKNTAIDMLGSRVDRMVFRNVADTNHFKKYKMNTSYLEAPIELRFTKNPENPNNSFKAALGVKIGTLVSASVKGKNLVNRNGTAINNYTAQEKSRRYFNSTRASLTARVGYGIVSTFVSYQLNAFIKDGFGPDLQPVIMGITLSGL